MTDITTLKPTPPIAIEDEMQRSYLDYAMSVIVSRALPDVRDGMKPVHRRILYAMKMGGFTSDKPYRKSARIVGDVMGKYHPHGDGAIYDALVRMAQPFSLSVPLIDGQGNFGSIDNDPPAAMRYTESRLEKAAEINLEDIDKDTVDFRPNYDENETEPVVLPARFPALLVNGAGGIAVGMATNIPPHNLGEVIDGCFAYLENPEITSRDLMKYIPAPDFPTGGIILGRSGAHSMYEEGRGSIRLRAQTKFEELSGNREAIVVTEIPYQLNTARLYERLNEIVKEGLIDGISLVRDESDRDGVRIVIELKRDAHGEIVLNQLFKYTPLQTSFGANILALNNGRPERMSLQAIVKAFIDFREEVVVRRTKYLLKKSRARAHILVGLAIAVANIDEIIKLIRAAPDPNVAREQLKSRDWPAGDIAPLIRLVNEPGQFNEEKLTYRLSDAQAKAILDLKLHRLTGLERDKIAEDLNGVIDSIKWYLKILSDRETLIGVIRDELQEVKDKFATPRRTQIIEDAGDVNIEDLIARQEMVVTVTAGGYIKRVALETYRAQKRGGKGRSGMATKDEDMLTDIFVANTHSNLVFFSTKGMAYSLKTYQLPEGTPQSKGRALINLLPLDKDEGVSVVMHLPDSDEEADKEYIMFATSHGTVRRNKLSDFMNIRSNGLIAMKLDDNEEMIAVRRCTEHQDILLASHHGQAIRFPVTDIRVFAGRNSTGVRGIKLQNDDYVVNMAILNHVEATTDERSNYLKVAGPLRREEIREDEAIRQAGELGLNEARFRELMDQEQFVLTVSDRGFGKRSSAYEYRTSGRGGQGITNMTLNDKTGTVARSYQIEDEHQLMMVTNAGQVIRIPVNNIRITGRSSQGVTLFKVDKDEQIVSVAKIVVDEDEDGVEDGIDENVEAQENSSED